MSHLLDRLSSSEILDEVIIVGNHIKLYVSLELNAFHIHLYQ